MENEITLNISDLRTLRQEETKENCWLSKEEEAYQKIVGFDLNVLTIEHFSYIKKTIEDIWHNADFIIEDVIIGEHKSAMYIRLEL